MLVSRDPHITYHLTHDWLWYVALRAATALVQSRGIGSVLLQASAVVASQIPAVCERRF